MVSPASARARSGRQVNVLQALALLLAFVLVAGVGGVLGAGLVMPAVATTSALTDTSVKLFDDLPDELEPQPLSQQSRLYAADGSLLATFFWENRIVVPLEKISVHMQNAVIATEDRRFHKHGGVDVTGMGRALVRNVTTDSTEGASTLTQQYVKNILIEAAHSRDDRAAVRAATESKGNAGLNRKLSEAKMAIALEKRLTKEQILEGYLNIAQFGLSVWGVEAAARHFFSVSAEKLTPLQAATIAGVTQAPGTWDPERNPEAAEGRRNVVLSLMHREGYISKKYYDGARKKPIEDTLKISGREPGCSTAGGSAFFCEYVTDVIMNSQEFGKDRIERQQLLYRGGLDIHTTLDKEMQRIADEEVRKAVPTKDRSGFGAALSVVEPGSGKVLAMAQNRRFNPRKDPSRGETAVNYNTDYAYGNSRGFQVGSTFKPFVLAEWLRQGRSLNDIVNSTPRAWRGDEWTASCIGSNPYFYDGTWEPGNVDGNAAGPISVAQATAKSINTAYVDMINQLDLCKVAATAEKIGFHRAKGDDIAVVPAMSLGANEASPMTMALAFATFAAGGTYCEPLAITKVTDANGEQLPIPPGSCREVLDPKIAATVTHALTLVMTQGSGSDAQLAGRPSAGKTGTAQENRHTWFVGYTPQLAATVWIGHPDRDTPMQNIDINGVRHPIVYGSTIAAPTWDRFMTRALEGEPVEWFPSPDDTLVNGDQVQVPYVVGRSVDEATAILRGAGFGVRVRERATWSDVPAGLVARTEPGGMAPRGSTVTIVPSAGPEGGGGGRGGDDGGGGGGGGGGRGDRDDD